MSRRGRQRKGDTDTHATSRRGRQRKGETGDVDRRTRGISFLLKHREETTSAGASLDDAEKTLNDRAVNLAQCRRHLEVAVASILGKIREEELSVAKKRQDIMRTRCATPDKETKLNVSIPLSRKSVRAHAERVLTALKKTASKDGGDVLRTASEATKQAESELSKISARTENKSTMLESPLRTLPPKRTEKRVEREDCLKVEVRAWKGEVFHVDPETALIHDRNTGAAIGTWNDESGPRILHYYNQLTIPTLLREASKLRKRPHTMRSTLGRTQQRRTRRGDSSSPLRRSPQSRHAEKMAKKAETFRLNRLRSVKSTFKTSSMNTLHPSTTYFQQWKVKAKVRSARHARRRHAKHERERIRRIRKTTSSVNTGLTTSEKKRARAFIGFRQSRPATSRRNKEREILEAMQLIGEFRDGVDRLVSQDGRSNQVGVVSSARQFRSKKRCQTRFQILSTRTPISRARAMVAANRLRRERKTVRPRSRPSTSHSRRRHATTSSEEPRVERHGMRARSRETIGSSSTTSSSKPSAAAMARLEATRRAASASRRAAQENKLSAKSEFELERIRLRNAEARRNKRQLKSMRAKEAFERARQRLEEGNNDDRDEEDRREHVIAETQRTPLRYEDVSSTSVLHTIRKLKEEERHRSEEDTENQAEQKAARARAVEIAALMTEDLEARGGGHGREDDDRDRDERRSNKKDDGEISNTSSYDNATSDADWIEYVDEHGRPYYYNTTTGESVWDKPSDEPSERVEKIDQRILEENEHVDDDGEKEECPETKLRAEKEIVHAATEFVESGKMWASGVINTLAYEHNIEDTVADTNRDDVTHQDIVEDAHAIDATSPSTTTERARDEKDADTSSTVDVISSKGTEHDDDVLSPDGVAAFHGSSTTTTASTASSSSFSSAFSDSSSSESSPGDMGDPFAGY